MKNIFILASIFFYTIFYSPTESFAQWEQTNGPTVGDSRISALVVSGRNLFAGVINGGTFLSTDNGTNWSAIGISTGLSSGVVLAVNGSHLFAGTEGAGISLSTNSGTSWTTTSLTNLHIAALATKDSNVYAASGFLSGGHFYLSTNNGTTWTKTNDVIENAGDISILAIAVSGNNIFVGGSGSGQDPKGFICLSTNNGTSWTNITPVLTSNYVYSLAIIDTNIFAGTIGDGAFRSTNNGTDWFAINTGLTDNDVLVFAISPNEKGGTKLFAGTDGGVFLSTNNGTNWTAVNTGLKSNTISTLAVSDEYLFASGQYYDGVWRRPLSEMKTSIEQTSNQLPEKFVLNQNYPNPFNPNTIISFSLPSKFYVSLKIYDVLGRELSVLVSEELLAGTYTKQLNASGLASGIYFYQMQAGSFIKTKKLVVLR